MKCGEEKGEGMNAYEQEGLKDKRLSKFILSANYNFSWHRGNKFEMGEPSKNIVIRVGSFHPGKSSHINLGRISLTFLRFQCQM